MARSGNTPKGKAKAKKQPVKKKSAKKGKGFGENLKKAVAFIRSPEGRKVFALLLLLVSAFMLIAFASHFWTGYRDQSALDGDGSAPRNWLGSAGAWVSDLFVRKGFGIPAIFIPIYTGLWGFAILEKNYSQFLWRMLSYLFFTVLWGSTMLFFISTLFKGEGLIGGGFGETINLFLSGMFGKIGTGLILLVSVLIFLVVKFNTEFPISRIFGKRGLEVESGEESNQQIAGEGAGEGAGEEEAQGEEKDPNQEPEKETEEKDKKSDFVVSVRPAEGQEKPAAEEKPAEAVEEKPVVEEKPAVELNPTVDQKTETPDSGTIDLGPPILPGPDQIPEIKTHRGDKEKPDGFELAIEETAQEVEVDPNQPIGDNIQQVQGNTYEKIVPETDKESLEGEEDLGDWEDYDPKLELSDYQYPPIDILKQFDASKSREVNRSELEANKNKIVETLQHYKIDIKSIKATIGPTVTLYEIVPAPGVRISKIRNLEDDIALSLAALGIRIIAPIPGKGTIGIEIPNSNPEIVGMRSVLATEKFRDTKAELPLALGRTISNEVFIADLSKMPHMLIAGATGQGKSVGINGIISSILFKRHPSQVKFVLIDPKKVELNLYEGLLQHFIAKLENGKDAIITDTKQVVGVLNSLCLEMDNRYDLLKKAKSRNLREYNEKFINRRLNPKKGHRFMPYIVLIIDEFADLMMTAGKEIEAPVARLAQLARAIGIHLILATQRPSVNVITGIIKANFPARISYRVMSKIDSRTILDSGGADQLIGRGDMLLSTGGELVRIQNAFIDTPEVDALVEFIGNQRGYPEPYFLPEVPMEGDDNLGDDDDVIERDKMFEEAARLIVKHQQGSTSLIQRRLKLGYNRAGRIIDQLERAGIVGPFSGSKARDVYCTDEYALEQILNSLD